MYSSLNKFVMLVVAVASLVTGGVASQTGPTGLWVGLVFNGGLALFFFERECRAQGAQPLTALRPREYQVEAVLPDSWKKASFLVVSWHVDYGHYEFRLVDVKKMTLEGPEPRVGDMLRVYPNGPSDCMVIRKGGGAVPIS